MSSVSTYHETTLAFDGEPLHAAARIVEAAARDDYVLYERDHEWCIGMGIHARVFVYQDRVVAQHAGGEVERPIADYEDLNTNLHAVLNDLPIERWRAYGLAPFEMSRFLYGLDVEGEEPLLKLFVPLQEVRFSKGSVLLRALDADDLASLTKTVEEACAAGPMPEASPLGLVEEVQTHNAESYKKTVKAALMEIWAHDYRKVIISRRVPVPHTLDMVASYVTGRQANAPARSYLLRLDGLEAGGFSPETVVEVTHDRKVFTTPLAGTRSTGRTLADEIDLREELLSDSKEIAEHAISVYIAFEELSGACDPASVAVVYFMLVFRRGAVQHLASRLRGDLSDGYNPWHAFSVVFPAVTASGVPKKESIDAIGRIEPQARGLYAGCVMICDQEGMLDAALVLRSFYQQGGEAWMQAGAGIMNQSQPERELEETREKLSSFSAYLVGKS